MGRHLVLGQLTDYATGEVVADTHDERLRQQVAHLLLDELGYQRSELQARRTLTVQTERHEASCTIDFAIRLEGRTGMIIRYAPGALVARERPTVALARLLEPTIVPWAAITNGRDARMLDAVTGRLHATGLAGLPHKTVLLDLLASYEPAVLTAEQRAAESRILTAFDVLKCACADDD
jgi:hypothetical protein